LATAPDFEPRNTLGLDLGQAQDYTALAVLEATIHLNPRDPDEAQCTYAVRYLERFPLGTSYTAIAATLVQRCAWRPLRGARVVLDHTGVGRAVVDLLKRARPDATLVPVTITAGPHAHRDDQGGWLVPKKDLVGCLQVLLQQHRLSVAAALAEAPTLVKELENF
jgi:threonine dehydrogenase-like Zn-dependent dehydrogenase